MLKFARNILGAAALISASASIASAQFTIYTDRSAFESALSSYYVDTFNANMVTTPGASVVSNVGSFSSGFWNDQLAVSGQTTTWSFAGGTSAFGGEWDMTPGGAGIGIALNVNWLAGGSASVGTEIPRTLAGEFWGFIANAKFTDVELVGGTQAFGVETHNFDNMTTGTTSVVPEPSTYALMAFGMGAVGIAARRRRKA